MTDTVQSHIDNARKALSEVKEPGGPARYEKLQETLSEIISAVEALSKKG